MWVVTCEFCDQPNTLLCLQNLGLKTNYAIGLLCMRVQIVEKSFSLFFVFAFFAYILPFRYFEIN